MADLITQGPDGSLDRLRRADHPLYRGRRHRRRHLAGGQARARTRPRPSTARRWPGRRCWPARRRSTRPATGCPDETVEAFRASPHRHQGSAHHARRWWLPIAQRGPPPDSRPLRLPAAGALVPRRPLAGPPSREGRHGDLPREHRGHLRRPRGRGRHARRRAKLMAFLRDGMGWEIREGSGIGIKPDLRIRLQAPHPGGHQLRTVPRSAQRDPRAQGQHPEVHRRRLPQLGLRAGARGVRRRRRRVGRLRRQARGQAPREGRHRRHHFAAGAHPRPTTSTSSPPPT